MSSTLGADAQLARVAVRQGGAFTRAQAAAAGFHPAQIERRVRTGGWERVHPCVYRYGATPMSAALVHWAAVLWAGPECALSHTSAAAIWRLPVASIDRPELIVPKRRAPRRAGVVVHRVARIDAGDILQPHGLPVTSPVRTLIDLGGVLAADDLEMVLLHALSHRLTTVRALGVRLAEMGTAGRPGAAGLRTLLASFGSAPGEPSARMAG